MSQAEEQCVISGANAEVGKIDTNTLKTILQSGVAFTLLDARAPKWDDGQRIPGAQSLTNEDPVQNFQTIIPKKHSLIIVYCSHLQCGASDRLIKRLKELGYSNILKYPEGIAEWINKGNAITKTK